MAKLKEKFSKPLLQLYDINKNFICNLSNRNLRNSAYSIKKKTTTNDVKTLTFMIPFDNEYIHNNSCEYWIKFEFDWYIIKTITLSSEEVTTLEVYCEDEFTISKSVLCEPLELIGCSPKEMFDGIMGATGDVTLDYKFKGTDIASYRSIITESEASVFENLIKMAEAFSAVIEMSTDKYGQKWIFLRKEPYNRGKVIRKDFDVASLTIEYNTSEIFTRLMPFGEPDDYGIDLNIGDVNPTGKLYIENYSYYEDMGMTSEEIANNPQCKAMTVRTYDNITDPAELLNIATEDLKTLCKPSVSGSLSFYDLSVLEDSSMIEPLVYEKLIVVDSKTKMRFESIIQEIEYDYDNPLESNVVLNNTITYNSIFKDLVTTGEKIDKITTTNPTTGQTSIIAGVIQGKINSAVTQIGTMLDTIESPESVYAILFEDRRVGSQLYGALAIGTSGILIAHELKPDNTWNWTTAIDSRGVNASNVTTGTLLADIIKAGTLSDINNTSWFNLEDGTFSYGNGAIIFDGEALKISIDGKSMEEIINDTVLTVIPNREDCIITLDEDLTPSKDTEYTFEFKVYKNNSTEEVPCVIKDVISSSQDVTTEWTNTTNTVKLKANTNTVFIDTEGSLEVTIETTIRDIKKVVYWNTIINTIEAPMLNLSASSQMFVKQDMYSDFEPDSIDITAQCIRCEISSWKYSINNGKTFNLIENGTNDIVISSNKLNIKNTSNLFDENNYIIIRAESDSGVSDNITITRIEDTDTFNVQLSNENHTFIADSDGMAYAQKIAIDVYAFKGTENVSATVGLIENIPDGMTITMNNNNSLNPSINIEVDESFDTISGTISIPVTISGVVIKKTFSYSLVKEGASGESASYVWALPTTLFFKEKGGETTPEEIKITSELSNCTFKNWSYSVDGKIWNTITTSNAGLTINADYTLIVKPSFSEFENSDSISFKITADSPTNVLCYDIITITKLKDGDDAFTVILDNEAHTFVGNYDGYAMGSSIDISPIGYVGVDRVPIKIGTITGKPTGMKSTITNNNTENPIIKITVNATMTVRSGTVTIPITATHNNITYNIDKIFSYSLSLDGTPASSCKITTNTTTFLSTDGGNTYEPSTITLTPNFTLCNFSKWQYLNNGTWTDVVTGSNGMTVNNQKLLVSISTPLFNEVENGVLSIRLITDETGVTDIISLYKLSQIDGISTELENMKSEIEQTNNAWKATFSTSSANNLILDGDFNRAFEEIYWANAYSTTLSYKTVNAYPFYDDKQTLSVKFETSSSSLQYYQDIELMPNTDYVYQCYIHTDNSVATSNLKPLHFWIWEGDTPQPVTLCTIVDYSQNLTIGRYNLCYVHFKTDDVQNALHGRFFMFTNGTSTSANLTFRQCGLYQNTMPIKWTPSSNEIVTGITTIDHKGIKVEHSNVDTTTRMSADGFTIEDDNGDILAWLSSKEQWTELKVDKVFANNVENVYTGDSYLYIDHSKAVAGDGTSSKPFNSFAQLSAYLQATPIINYDLYITVKDPGFVINEQLHLEGLKGAGFIKIMLEGNLVIANAGNGQFCMRFHQIDKWIWIEGCREFGSSTTGAVLCDGTADNGHGIYATDVDYLEVDAITISCKNWGIYTERTHLFTWHVDFGKTWCAIELTFMSLYYSSDDVGSCADFCRLKSGSFAYWGIGSVRPQGSIQAINGMYYDGGLSLTPTDSPRYPNANPTPSISEQVFTYTYNCTSKQSYQYSWSNWSTDGSCKQGAWGNLSPYVKKLA